MMHYIIKDYSFKSLESNFEDSLEINLAADPKGFGLAKAEIPYYGSFCITIDRSGSDKIVKRFWSIVEELLKIRKSIKTLTFDFCHKISLQPQIVASLNPLFNKSEHVIFLNSSISTTGIDTFFSQLSNNTTLKELVIHRENFILEERDGTLDFTNLVGLVNSGLQSLIIDGYHVDEECAKDLTTAIKNNRRIDTLALINCDLDNNVIRELFPLLCNLRILDLSRNYLGLTTNDDTVKIISQIFANRKNRLLYLKIPSSLYKAKRLLTLKAAISRPSCKLLRLNDFYYGNDKIANKHLDVRTFNKTVKRNRIQFEKNIKISVLKLRKRIDSISELADDCTKTEFLGELYTNLIDPFESQINGLKIFGLPRHSGINEAYLLLIEFSCKLLSVACTKWIEDNSEPNAYRKKVDFVFNKIAEFANKLIEEKYILSSNGMIGNANFTVSNELFCACTSNTELSKERKSEYFRDGKSYLLIAFVHFLCSGPESQESQMLIHMSLQAIFSREHGKQNEGLTELSLYEWFAGGNSSEHIQLLMVIFKLAFKEVYSLHNSDTQSKTIKILLKGIILLIGSLVHDENDMSCYVTRAQTAIEKYINFRWERNIKALKAYMSLVKSIVSALVVIQKEKHFSLEPNNLEELLNLNNELKACNENLKKLIDNEELFDPNNANHNKESFESFFHLMQFYNLCQKQLSNVKDQIIQQQNRLLQGLLSSNNVKSPDTVHKEVETTSMRKRQSSKKKSTSPFFDQRTSLRYEDADSSSDIGVLGELLSKHLLAN